MIKICLLCFLFETIRNLYYWELWVQSVCKICVKIYIKSYTYSYKFFQLSQGTRKCYNYMHAAIISLFSSGSTQVKCCPAWPWWRRETMTWNLCCSELQKTLCLKIGLEARATAWTGGGHWQGWTEILKLERRNEKKKSSMHCVLLFPCWHRQSLLAVDSCSFYSVKYPYLS